MRYIVESERDEDVPTPDARVLPEKYKNDPHQYIKLLNGNRLPYSLNSEFPTDSFSRSVFTLHLHFRLAQRRTCYTEEDFAVE
jgi:hypothetical protein